MNVLPALLPAAVLTGHGSIDCTILAICGGVGVLCFLAAAQLAAAEPGAVAAPAVELAEAMEGSGSREAVEDDGVRRTARLA